MHKDEIVAVGVRQDNLIYRMFLEVVTGEKQEANAATANLKTWHERMGHLNLKAMQKLLSTQGVDGVGVNGNSKFFCDECQMNKSHKLPFSKETKRVTQPGEMIHSDVCGPMSETSLGGARYYVSFIGDSTSYRYVYFIKHKIDAVESFITLDKLLRNKFERRIKTLRTDNGKEYVNERLTSYLKKQGITHERTAPYTPEQNGKAERENRTIVECARTMLNSAGSPRSLWAEAVNISVYLLNRVLVHTSEKNKTSYELWTGRKPN